MTNLESQSDMSSVNQGQLKQRVLAALASLVLFLTGLFYLPDTGWMVFIGMLSVLAWDEWLRLTNLGSWVARLLGAISLCAVFLCLTSLQPQVFQVVIAGLCIWFILFVATFVISDGPLWSFTFRRVSGLIVLTLAWWLFYWLRAQWYGPWWVLGFLCIIWLADIGAYFAGRRFGRHSLAPSISPGKTIEGVVGGLLCVGIVMLLIHQYYPVFPISWLLPVTLLIALVSVGGDLYESRLKRLAGVKDSGKILPGHGGFLDRIDGVLVGLPVFVFFVLQMGAFSV